MTKELYKKCRNQLMQAFCALDKETQTALERACLSGMTERLVNNGTWVLRQDLATPEGLDEVGDILWGSYVYRISDKAAPPPEPRYEDVPVYRANVFGKREWHYGEGDFLALAHGCCDFDGITYDTGFVESESYDPSYGTPVSVRFRK